jgi:hypothetical protein
MLTREEQRNINTFFWTAFRDYMKKEKSSNGRRINWLNYPSDVKDVYIRLHADVHFAGLTFDIQSKDDGIRSLLWEQLCELQKVMEERMMIKGEWNENIKLNDGKTISRITWGTHKLNYLKEEHRATIFEFLRSTILAFDVFYQEFKDILVNLTD